ncbi:MAG TPA: DUF3142 domain-containing protein [Blastocatellia bacterium]|nr:DUF3142 domain-containing protein [Blastocatellia bacterium]
MRLAAGSLAVALSAFILWSTSENRRTWEPSEVPVTFWAWRSTTPGETDVTAAVREMCAKAVFLYAGEISAEGSSLVRVRAPIGQFPRRVDLHLVYSATRELLARFERVEAIALAAAVMSAADEDLHRARLDGASVIGVQLDFDVPTRLLTKYAVLIRAIRDRLPPGLKLSITGLPTWMSSEHLREPLSYCDFWIPQCYGAQIARRVDQNIPTTSSWYVAETVAGARALRRPFYAGLAAYGYAIHYSRNGELLALRGDLDPLLVARSSDLDLVGREPIRSTERQNGRVGEWRLVYRARRDVMVGGTPVITGESLVLHIPTSAGLRSCALKVRQEAGERLLGICVFRLPTVDDPTTLTLSEVSDALNDRTTRFTLDARIERISAKASRDGLFKAVLAFDRNGGLRLGESLSLLVRVPPGALRSASSGDFSVAMPVFESGGETIPCAWRRANALRLSIDWWPPRTTTSATLEFEGDVPNVIGLEYIARMDDGEEVEGAMKLPITAGK